MEVHRQVHLLQLKRLQQRFSPIDLATPVGDLRQRAERQGDLHL